MVKLKIYDDIDIACALREGYWKGYIGGVGTILCIVAFCVGYIYG